MLKNKRIIAFTIYAICLLGIPAKMIFDQQTTFNEGTAYKFKCQPIDPNDPFRGKYVRLGFDEIIFSNKNIMSQNKFYGMIKVDNEGFAHIDKVIDHYSTDLVLLELDYPLFTNDSTALFTLPFDRLYMNENKAEAAEDLYRNTLSDETQNVYAKVYISEGRFLLDDVYINDLKLSDAID